MRKTVDGGQVLANDFGQIVHAVVFMTACGAPPFIAVQRVVLALLFAFPELATWLPKG